MSDFGRGLCYNLGLFLAHEDILRSDLQCAKKMREQPDVGMYTTDDRVAKMWFHGAGDHLFNLEADHAPEALRERVRAFQHDGLFFRDVFCPCVTVEDCQRMLQEAKDLLRAIDEAHGVPTEKGEFE